MDGSAELRNVSDTALVAAVVRAEETKRRRPLFRDPYAEGLAGERGRAMARRMRLRVISGGVVSRTLFYDDLIPRLVREDGVGCVLNLGAGLDTRPYRLDLPEDLRWVEADFPGILDHKEAALGGLAPRCRLTRVRTDLSDPAARAKLLDEASDGRPTLVVCEGLIPYLAEEDVAGLARDLAGRPGFQWWALDMLGPLFIQVAKKFAGRRMARADATLRFCPEAGTDFFRSLGWKPFEVRSSWEERRRRHCEPALMRAIWTLSPPRTREFLRQQGLFVLLRNL